MRVVDGLLALLLAGPGFRAAPVNQPNGCSEVNWDPLSVEDKAYTDAMIFGRSLIDHGITVLCTAPSKMTGMFEGQVGAAVYRTSVGNFDVLFLAPWESFDALQVNEARLDGRYQYTFAGRPKSSPSARLDGARPAYFVRDANRLLFILDSTLAARLRTALGQQ